MIANMLVILIVLGCAAFGFIQHNMTKSFLFMMAAILASIVGFGYYDWLADILIDQDIFINQAHSIAMLVLFGLSYAVFSAGTMALKSISFPLLVDKVGGAIFGFLMGLFISGFLINALLTMPLSESIPYQKVDPKNGSASEKKVLFNADNFVAGFAGIISRGSLGGEYSFDLLRGDYPKQAYLNRTENTKTVLTKNPLDVPENAIMAAPENLLDEDGQEIDSRSEDQFIVIRMGFRRNAANEINPYTLGQVRLITKDKKAGESKFSGQGKTSYPIGILNGNQLERSGFAARHQVEFPENSGTGLVDFVFAIPTDHIPVAFGFKQNGIAELRIPRNTGQN